MMRYKKSGSLKNKTPLMIYYITGKSAWLFACFGLIQFCSQMCFCQNTVMVSPTAKIRVYNKNQTDFIGTQVVWQKLNKKNAHAILLNYCYHKSKFETWTYGLKPGPLTTIVRRQILKHLVIGYAFGFNVIATPKQRLLIGPALN